MIYFEMANLNVSFKEVKVSFGGGSGKKDKIFPKLQKMIS